MWYKIKELYDKYTLQDRRNQLGQYELRDLLESCGYNDRFREASFVPLPVLPLREVLRGDLHEAGDYSRSGSTSGSDGV